VAHPCLENISLIAGGMNETSFFISIVSIQVTL